MRLRSAIPSNPPATPAALLLAAALMMAACAPPDDAGDPVGAQWPGELAVPIPGVTFSLDARHFPGASRDYRAGAHQGFDFVNGTASRPLGENETVVAVADGEILRIDHDHAEPAPEVLEHWTGLADEPGFFGAHALDRLRGRQVWLRHSDGHVSRYAHLSAVHPELQPGAAVQRGQPLGATGTNGIAPGADAADPAPHLHYELWSPNGARHLCQDLEALDCHREVREVFGESALPRYARGVLAAMDEGEPAPDTYPPAELPDTGFSANPPRSVTAGSAFSVPATWKGDAFHPNDVFSFLEGYPMGVVNAGDGAWIIAAVPLAFQEEQAQLVIGAADAYGQSLAGGRAVAVNPREGIPAAVALPQEVLALYTEENRQAENRRLGPVIMRSMERREPRWNGPFAAPLEGTVTRRFGQEAFQGIMRPAHPVPGVVIGAAEDVPVRASNGGRVALVEEFPIRGLTVVLDHGGGVMSLYAHLSEVNVAPDDIVDHGQVIGAAGNTGATTGPQLRWEIHVAGIPTDPLEWLDRVLPNRQPAPSG